ncbi:amidohydrolase family protein [Bradyrhizobium sp. ISRA443]|uniref:amidohydrolase family protein n=1 Tax=unclassified Bradyrhizobium TaxID=2631580 RepID=UPI00247AE9A5|nr:MULTISPECIES: amidohydrolase family protein [unclassified Bradyrhizobium]WGR91658.1 amidohydrolase family protein [Bradyrhizobium sp. ISRA435]WGS01977.1 amidohydrolase family protein [Bradyrhizobium sp. ISRA436]WGS08862.1 amidohydrolase family protein [Bradyrhizobium sp. ISRA437]WGS15751.1 amidohydrolase family protein [Bradyrhizobium sp. ISRA443]
MTRIWLRTALLLGLLGSAAITATAHAETVVLRGGNLYASPDAAPLLNSVIVMTDGVISAVGKSGDIQVPADARVIDCSGKTIVAGFWNSHVHFTQGVWRNAGTIPAAPLTEHMQQMLTRWGFTTVWDLGSDPRDTLALRRRIAANEVAGPNILLAGSIFPKDGHPAYLPAEMQLPEASTPDDASQLARTYMNLNLDGVKLFTGVYKGNKPVVNMDPAVAKAAVDVAHAQGKPVFAHPQNRIGVETVIAAGVDVLAHTVPSESSYTAEQLAHFKAQGIALIPTLSLFTTVVLDPAVTNRLLAATVNQLEQFSENGGAVLFGTDVGFTKLYDTTQEYELMHRALSERQILASLTSNPARYFKAAKKGRVEQGFDADVVVLDGDPLNDVRNLAKVSYTIRAGHVIYQKP